MGKGYQTLEDEREENNCKENENVLKSTSVDKARDGNAFAFSFQYSYSTSWKH